MDSSFHVIIIDNDSLNLLPSLPPTNPHLSRSQTPSTSPPLFQVLFFPVEKNQVFQIFFGFSGLFSFLLLEILDSPCPATVWITLSDFSAYFFSEPVAPAAEDSRGSPEKVRWLTYTWNFGFVWRPFCANPLRKLLYLYNYWLVIRLYSSLSVLPWNDMIMELKQCARFLTVAFIFLS